MFICATYKKQEGLIENLRAELSRLQAVCAAMRERFAYLLEAMEPRGNLFEWRGTTDWIDWIDESIASDGSKYAERVRAEACACGLHQANRILMDWMGKRGELATVKSEISRLLEQEALARLAEIEKEKP